MNTLYREIIRNATSLLEPIPTDMPPKLCSLAGAQVILFDVYGTMLISASGDVGTAQQRIETNHFAEALSAVVQDIEIDANGGESIFRQSIAEAHAGARAAGIEYPEVDIVAIWQTTLDRLVKGGGFRRPQRLRSICNSWRSNTRYARTPPGQCRVYCHVWPAFVSVD